MHRRALLTASTLAMVRSLLAGGGGPSSVRLGLCTFSCHQHWKAAGAGHEGVKFRDAAGFYAYARALGAGGVQTPLRGADPAAFRRLVEESGGGYEGELRLPKTEGDLAGFGDEVRRTREAGATVARAVFTGGRRYEIFKSREEFDAFHAQSRRSLALAEPVLKRHRLKLAVENHKDLTTEELVAMMKEVGSEWIGVLVDTGNNLALLEEPHGVVEALAPFALSVHLKDMAVQPWDDGFLLSEVPLGTGLLDLPRIAATLLKANPGIVFNLEMATRDPLRVPCLTDAYFATFPDRRGTHLEAALDRVRAHPPEQAPPSVSGKDTARILAEEESNNRRCLDWMHRNLRASRSP